MSHNIALSRQLRRDPIKTGGIIINPEDALPSMRDNIHVLKDGTHYVQLKPADQHNKDFQSREFRYEFGGRRRQQRDLVKTGGILINPEDALPSMRDQIHTAKNGTTFALLKPYNQRPHTGSSSNSQAQTFERNFEYEFIPTSSFAQGRNDVVKTGGILISPEDALPSMRNSLHALRSGDYCALLKPWSQLQAEKSEGRGTSRSEGTRKFSHELTLTRPNRERDVIKTGGIIINPEDALPSMRDSIHVLKNGAHYVQLKPWDQFQAERAQASRRSSGKRLEGGRRFSLELTRNPIKEDRVKTGGIIINPEDALPSMRHSIHVLPKSGAHYVNLRTWGQVRDEQGGHIHVPPSQATESTNNEPYVSRQGELRELPREQPQVEPVKTGGIVINPRDVLAEKRGELNFVPNSNTVYANLKPWSKIQKEQGGVVHAKKIKASYDQENMGENVPSLENIDTKTTLKSLDSRLDSILMRSRSFLSEPSINDVQAARQWGNSFMAF